MLQKSQILKACLPEVSHEELGINSLHRLHEKVGVAVALLLKRECICLLFVFLSVDGDESQSFEQPVASLGTLGNARGVKLPVTVLQVRTIANEQ